MKILIIRISSLGDIILTESFVNAIAEQFPDAEIHFLSRSPMQQVFPFFRTKIQFYDWKQKKQCLQALQLIYFDYVFDLHRKFNTFIIKKALNAKHIFSYDKLRLKRWLLIKKFIKNDIDSTIDLYFSALEKAGLHVKKSTPKFVHNEQLDSKVHQKMQSFNIHFSKHLIGLFPGATHETKRYPTELWIRFLDLIPHNWNVQVVLMGGFKEKKICTEIKRKSKADIVDFCGATSIEELITAVSKMKIVLSNDSGPMHIAAAFSLPQIAIFGATHTCLGFRPVNKNAIVLQADIKCQPCSLHGGKTCPKNTFLCMYKIYPVQIFKAFKQQYETAALQMIPQ